MIAEQTVQPEPRAARFLKSNWFAAARLTVAFDECDTYDGVHRLRDMVRGKDPWVDFYLMAAVRGARGSAGLFMSGRRSSSFFSENCWYGCSAAGRLSSVA